MASLMKIVKVVIVLGRQPVYCPVRGDRMKFADNRRIINVEILLMKEQ